MSILKSALSIGLCSFALLFGATNVFGAVAGDDQVVKPPVAKPTEVPATESEPRRTPIRWDLRAGQFQSKQMQESLKAYQEALKAWQAYQELAANKQQEVSPYWIGVQCEPIAEVPLLSGLPGVGELFHKGGLKVTAVVADSPAEKAEIKIGDVIIKARDVATDELGALLGAVGKAKENELELQIIRDKKLKTIRVTPLKRPTVSAEKRLDWTPTLPHRQNLNEWQHYNTPVVSFQKLPDDVELTLKKKGNAAAEITVKRGDLKWNVSENDLDKLPADIRYFVQQLVSATTSRQANMSFVYPYAGGMLFPTQPVAPRADPTVNDQLKELSKRLEQLQKAVDELKSDK